MTYVLRNSHFSNKETAFSGPWVVWSLFGAPGEKKRQNQMFLQDLQTFAPLQYQNLQIGAVSLPVAAGEAVVTGCDLQTARSRLYGQLR